MNKLLSGYIVVCVHDNIDEPFGDTPLCPSKRRGGAGHTCPEVVRHPLMMDEEVR